MKGSQKCGRIEHSMVAGQTAADINRVRELKEKLELVYVELEPGIFAFNVNNFRPGQNCQNPTNNLRF